MIETVNVSFIAIINIKRIIIQSRNWMLETVNVSFIAIINIKIN